MSNIYERGETSTKGMTSAEAVRFCLGCWNSLMPMSVAFSSCRESICVQSDCGNVKDKFKPCFKVECIKEEGRLVLI